MKIDLKVKYFHSNLVQFGTIRRAFTIKLNLLEFYFLIFFVIHAKECQLPLSSRTKLGRPGIWIFQFD